MYDQLLKVKQHHEDKALSAMEVCQFECEQQENALEVAITDMEDFIQFRKVEKVRLFDELKGEEVSVKSVDVMNRKVALLKEKELEHIKMVEEQRKKVAQAYKDLEESKVIFHQARMQVNKYEELLEHLHLEEKQESERKEELESESITLPKRMSF